MSIKPGVVLSRELILSKVSEEEIFGYYFQPVIFGVSLKNLLRDDTNPGCRYFYDKINQRVKFRDFSRGETYDCFDIASKVLKTDDFNEVLRRIATDFGIIDETTPRTPIFNPGKESILEVHKKEIIVNHPHQKFSWKERAYWIEQGIREIDLVKFDVYSFDTARLKLYFTSGAEKEVPIYRSSSELRFAYWLEDKEWKLYFPERAKGENKFYHISNLYQGYNKLPKNGEVVIITKAYKDVIALSRLEIPAIAPQSENTLIDKWIVDDLSERFERVFILYDNDIAGMKALAKNVMNHPRLIPLLFPNDLPKDVTDNIKFKGLDKTGELLKYYVFQRYISNQESKDRSCLHWFIGFY